MNGVLIVSSEILGVMHGVMGDIQDTGELLVEAQPLRSLAKDKGE